MGFPNSIHIKRFVEGNTIADISQNGRCVWLTFTTGEKLRLEPWPHFDNQNQIIATPFRVDGEVKQTTEIIRKICTCGGEPEERDADCDVHGPGGRRASYLRGMRDADLARIQQLALRVKELEDHFKAYVELVATAEKVRDETAAERDAARKECQSWKDAHSVAAFDRDQAKAELDRRSKDCEVYRKENEQLRIRLAP